jgi:hypothetical protein
LVVEIVDVLEEVDVEEDIFDEFEFGSEERLVEPLSFDSERNWKAVVRFIIPYPYSESHPIGPRSVAVCCNSVRTSMFESDEL